jgi:hypothetical protein
MEEKERGHLMMRTSNVTTALNGTMCDLNAIISNTIPPTRQKPGARFIRLWSAILLMYVRSTLAKARAATIITGTGEILPAEEANLPVF